MKKRYLSLIGIFLLFTFFATLACKKEKESSTAIGPRNTSDTMTNKDTTAIVPITGLKFLALGDSYTIGQNVDQQERFPAQTVNLLKKQQIEVADVEYIATTGWTTTNLLSAIEVQKPAKDFDIVTLLIGVNNQYQQGDAAVYRKEFAALLDLAVNFAKGKKPRVFVLSIPDYSATPYVRAEDKASVSRQIDDFNAINREVTTRSNITYLDITPSSKLAANDSSLIADDGLHPSGKEYAVWASLLAPAIKKALQ